jgi:heat shock protein HslJ
MKRILIALIVVILSISIVGGLTACNTVNSKLEDTKWFLSSYGEQTNLKAIIDGTEITATFNNADGNISGSAGCNTYFAGYETKGNELSISEIGCTEMYCISPEGVMEQEQEFLSLLGNAQTFEVDDTTLTIVCSDGQQLYFSSVTE